MSSITRVVGFGVAAALVAAIAGWALERVRFGGADEEAVARIRAGLQQRFDQGADTLRAMAARIAAERMAIRAASRDSAAVKRLFDQAEAVLPADARERTGLTVYDAAAVPLAWAGRVSDLPKTRIEGPAALFVAPGALGPRLIWIAPLVEETPREGPRVATIVVEQVLADLTEPRVPGNSFVVATSLAPVTLGTRIGGAAPPPDPYRFTIDSPSGGVLVDGELSPADLAAARRGWSRRTWAAVCGVLTMTLLLCIGPILDRRGRTGNSIEYVTLTSAMLVVLVGARALFSLATSLAMGLHPPASPVELLADGLTFLAIVWMAIDLIERRRLARPRARLLKATVAWTALVGAAYLVAGIAGTWILVRYEMTLGAIISNNPVDLLHFSHDALTGERLGLAFSLVLLDAAVIWTAAAIVRAPRVFWRTPRAIGRFAVVGWALGIVLTLAWAVGRFGASVPAIPLVVALAAAAACAAALEGARAKARRRSQAMQLTMVFLALVVPALATYPSVLALTTAVKEQRVVNVHRPQIESQRKDLQDRMRRALDEIDAIPGLGDFAVLPPEEASAASDRAFRLWSQTDLARYRQTSAVELYAGDGRLSSRFALNLPESTGAQYRAAGCEWDLFDEESPFGSNGRHVLRASRGICEDGRLAGAVVVRAMLDYRTLPFSPSQSPYLATLQRDPQSASEDIGGSDLEFEVYGWSRAPMFASGTRVWALPDEVFDRMVASREPLWATIDRDGQSFRVYVFNDRGGIYALGYPVITAFGHLINLVELGTLALVLYVVLLGAGMLVNAITSRRSARGHALLREVRSSFYRKLFLYFVAGAVVPVVILAFATRTYFAAQLRAGIDEAAAKTATVAQRLVEDYAALQQRGPGALDVIDDQIMVLVGQAIDQDVNLFERGRLQATSERDLFESQLLSTRTPADVYRTILLDRLPTFVGEETVGGFRYRLAGAPVRAGGREGIVTVPLALRQQEIEQQIDELDHRVLFGAVFFSLVGAAVGYWMAERIADPVNRLTRATRRIARGDLDARIAATSSDELRRLVEDFNQMAADLKRQRTELERTQRLEAWADMARQVAHDIKNPLTPIQLSAEHARRINLDRGRPLSPVLDECVSAILTQVKLLRQISAEFSSFGSAPRPRPAPTELPPLIEQVVEPYRTGLAARIAIDISAPADLPPVNIDPTLFARALTNVIENALHAMPGAGRLTISGHQSPVVSPQSPGVSPQSPVVSPQSPVVSLRSQSSVVVEITDTGVGMDEEALGRIFEPYFSTKATGTGLGLTIAKRNVELNGGTIEVTSERGAGTKVTITLPG